MQYARLAAVVSFALGLAAFAETTAAQDAAQRVAGTYTLFEVNGQAPPILTDQDNGCREEVLSATLTLEANGSWRLNYMERETCGASVREDPESDSGRFIMEGNTIVFSDDDESHSSPNEIDFDELGTATLSGDVLTVTLQDRRTVVKFRR